MRIKNLVMLTAIAGLAVIMAMGGCKKKQEPAAPAAATENMTRQATETAQAATQAAGTIEQTICPVMGGKINKDIFTEYKGKKVYFCCASCKAEFDKNPEKYISKLPQFQN